MSRGNDSTISSQLKLDLPGAQTVVDRLIEAAAAGDTEFNHAAGTTSGRGHRLAGLQDRQPLTARRAGHHAAGMQARDVRYVRDIPERVHGVDAMDEAVNPVDAPVDE